MSTDKIDPKAESKISSDEQPKTSKDELSEKELGKISGGTSTIGLRKSGGDPTTAGKGF